MAVGFFAKVAVRTAKSDPASSGSNRRNPKPMPPFSWPSSTAVPGFSTSSMPEHSTSAQVTHQNAPSFFKTFYLFRFQISINQCCDCVGFSTGIFKSLLYEACGRIVNPTFGSVGLLSSGNWVQCQAAVDAVLAGLPIVENNEPVPYLNPVPPVNSCDIRHVSKDTSLGKTRNRFKRSRSKVQLGSITEAAAEWGRVNPLEFGQCSSGGGGERSMQSVETVEAPWEMNRGKPDPVGNGDEEEVGLELTLGFGFGKLKGKA